MKILLTGGTGFIGSHLRAFLRKQKVDLTVLLRPESKTEELDKKNIHYFIFDGDAERLSEYMQQEQFSGVVHLASLYLKEHKPSDIGTLLNSNVIFPTKVLQAAATAQIPWFINTGTFWQHYQDEEYSPINLYAATKQAFEDVSRYYYQTTAINFVTLALSDTFGPDDTRPKIFTLWKKIANTTEKFKMSAGEQILDISYIDNVIDAYWQLMQLAESGKNMQGRTFAVSHNEKMSLRDLSKVYETVTNTTLPIEWGALPYRSREVMQPWTKGEPVPGWKSKISLAQGIKKLSEKT